MCDELQKEGKQCHCKEGNIRYLVQARILLEIARKPAHGYELLDSLGQNTQTAIDSGSLYRVLRSMEVDGMVMSSWETSGGGPARRIYELSAPGFEYLDALVGNIRSTQAYFDAFLNEYELLLKSRNPSN